LECEQQLKQIANLRQDCQEAHQAFQTPSVGSLQIRKGRRLNFAIHENFPQINNIFDQSN
jgi:hypothetical protein